VLPILNARSISIHLDFIGRKVANGAHAVFILDGTGFHIEKDLKISVNMMLTKASTIFLRIELDRKRVGLLTVRQALRNLRRSNILLLRRLELLANDPESMLSITSRTWATVKG